MGDHHRLVLKVVVALGVELPLGASLAVDEAARAAPSSCDGNSHQWVVGIIPICPLTILQAFPTNARELDLDADRDFTVRGLVLGLLLLPLVDVGLVAHLP